MSLFTPFSGFIGGSLIGLSASVLLLLNGDVMGASGILSSSFLPNTSAQQWKLAFLAAFLITVQLLMQQKSISIPDLEEVPVVSAWGQALGGLLVGLGTRLGNGCTSGHGICGLARLSKRSFVAVMTFMITAVATVCLISCMGLPFAQTTEKPDFFPLLGYLLTAYLILRALWPVRISGEEEEKQRMINKSKLGGAILAGSIFALGLGISQMVSVAKVRGFLDLSLIAKGTYDPTLMTVMGGGVLVSALAYYISGHPNLLCLGTSCALVPAPIARVKSQVDVTFDGVPKSTSIDGMLIGGSVLFGLGWGIAGMCPGPALFLAAAGSEAVIHQWLPMYFVGSYLATAFKERVAKSRATLG